MEKQTLVEVAEMTSGATKAFAGDLKFPWLQNSVIQVRRMFPLCIQNTVLTYCLKYNWSELPLKSIAIISTKGCMTGVHFDQSLVICLFPSSPANDVCF